MSTGYAMIFVSDEQRKIGKVKYTFSQEFQSEGDSSVKDDPRHQRKLRHAYPPTLLHQHADGQLYSLHSFTLALKLVSNRTPIHISNFQKQHSNMQNLW